MELTKTEKIAKLAKWLGSIERGVNWFSANGVWNPLINIADAWILVEKGRNIAEFLSKVEATISYNGAGIFHMTALEAANAISEVVLEVIDGSKTKR